MNLKDVIYTHFKAGLLTLATSNALCEPSLKLRELGTMSGCVNVFSNKCRVLDYTGRAVCSDCMGFTLMFSNKSPACCNAVLL